MLWYLLACQSSEPSFDQLMEHAAYAERSGEATDGTYTYVLPAGYEKQAGQASLSVTGCKSGTCISGRLVPRDDVNGELQGLLDTMATENAKKTRRTLAPRVEGEGTRVVTGTPPGMPGEIRTVFALREVGAHVFIGNGTGPVADLPLATVTRDLQQLAASIRPKDPGEVKERLEQMLQPVQEVRAGAYGIQIPKAFERADEGLYILGPQDVSLMVDADAPTGLRARFEVLKGLSPGREAPPDTVQRGRHEVRRRRFVSEVPIRLVGRQEMLAVEGETIALTAVFRPSQREAVDRMFERAWESLKTPE